MAAFVQTYCKFKIAVWIILYMDMDLSLIPIPINKLEDKKMFCTLTYKECKWTPVDFHFKTKHLKYGRKYKGLMFFFSDQTFYFLRTLEQVNDCLRFSLLVLP